MLDKVNIVQIMDDIKAKVKEEGTSVAEQNLASAYYVRRMKEYYQQKQLVIFGVGEYGMGLHRMLEREKLSDKVKCFCDNNQQMQNKEYKGIPIIAPDQAIHRFPEAMFVITPTGYENEILRQLVHLGVNVEQISIFVYELTELEK